MKFAKVDPADRPPTQIMKTNPSPLRLAEKYQAASGKVGWILLWLVGIPVPVLLVLFLLRGCT
jgi:hypothetical protein